MAAASAPLRLVDLGECDAAGSLDHGRVRACWAHPRDATQWKVFRDGDRTLVVEGQPDRAPRPGERLDHWLDGRWGSFRGFEVAEGEGPGAPPRVSAFVDPLGTRPVFYLRVGDEVLISDKLATLALNARGRASVNWGAVLEALAFGAYYSPDTTLEGAEELKPGGTIRAIGDRVAVLGARGLPDDAVLSPGAVRARPAETLLDALRRAVAETWTDPATWLTLSGGLDSRFTLGLAAPPRKAFTVTTTENRESRTAREIAQACGAEFRHFPRPVEHYHRLACEGFLLAGCMHAPHFAHHLGLGQGWRRQGIASIAHAFLYDTLLKGYFIRPRLSHPSLKPPFHDLMGPIAGIFARSSSVGHQDEGACGEFFMLLSDEGRELARRRIAAFSRGVDADESGRLDCTMERFILRRIARQVHYSIFLGWLEAVDVQSPVFHPALWAWHHFSSPEDRHRGKAFRRALKQFDHPVAHIVDTNTGGDVEAGGRERWRERFIDVPAYRTAKAIWRAVRPARPSPRTADANNADEGSWPSLCISMAQPRAIEILEEGCALLGDNPLFDRGAIEAAILRHRSDNPAYGDLLCAVGSAGRWGQLVRGQLGPGLDHYIKQIAGADAAAVHRSWSC